MPTYSVTTTPHVVAAAGRRWLLSATGAANVHLAWWDGGVRRTQVLRPDGAVFDLTPGGEVQAVTAAGTASLSAVAPPPGGNASLFPSAVIDGGTATGDRSLLLRPRSGSSADWATAEVGGAALADREIAIVDNSLVIGDGVTPVAELPRPAAGGGVTSEQLAAAVGPKADAAVVLDKGANLGDIADPAEARTNLGLSAAATLSTQALAADEAFRSSFFGALVCQPSGASDHTARLQAFLDSWASTGGEAVLPPGIWTVTGNLTFTGTKPGRLYAHGATIKVGASFPAGANPVLSVRGTALTFTGLTIDGSDIADRLMTVRANSVDVSVEACNFLNAGQQAAETDVNTVGLRIEGNVVGVNVTACNFRHIVAGAGVNPSFARGILISNPTTTSVTKEVRIRSCTFTDILFAGVSIDADAICIQDFTDNVSTIIDGCHFRGIHKRAAKIMSPGVVMSNCTVEQPFTGASGVNVLPQPQVYAAISVYADDCVVTGNIITGGSWLHGIEVGSAPTTTRRVTVANNRVVGGSGATMTGSAGIRVYGDNTCSEILISNNYIGRFVNGIWLSTAAVGVVVSGNQGNCYGLASSSGILIDGQGGAQPTRVVTIGNAFEGVARYVVEAASVPTDWVAVGNMGGRTGFEVINSGAYSYSARRTFAVANGGGGSVASGADGTQGSYLPQGAVLPRVVKTIVAVTYSASMTPDARLGDWQAITVTNGSAMTVNAPSGPPSAAQSQRLVIEVFNNSGGAMGVITWAAAYVFPGVSWSNPASGKRRHAVFEWNGAAWLCTSITGANY